jgi:hypothetical protein
MVYGSSRRAAYAVDSNKQNSKANPALENNIFMDGINHITAADNGGQTATIVRSLQGAPSDKD